MRRWMIWGISGVVLAAASCAITLSWADDVLHFQPVSAESAARLEAKARRARATPRHTASAHAATDTLTRLPALPAAPEAPSAPALPSIPRHSGEMMRIGSDITIERDQTVEGDVVAISGDIHVDGHVKGSVQALGGDVYLSSTSRVDGDVAAVRGELHEEPGASVGGQRVTALGGSNVRIGHRHLAEAADLVARPLRQLWHFMRTLAWLLVMLGMVWLIVRIAAVRTEIAVSLLRRETAAALGVGLLTWVLLVPSVIALALVVAILCITIIGIPVAIAALFGYALFLMLLFFWGFIVGAAWLGAQFRGALGGDSTMRHALVGTAAVIGMRAIGHLIGIIPWFGFVGGFLVVVSYILSCLLVTLGAGALLRSESASGYLGRWWRNWRGTPVMATAPAGAAPGAVAGATPGPVAQTAPPPPAGPAPTA